MTNLDILEQLADRLFRYSGLDEAKRLVEEACEEHPFSACFAGKGTKAIHFFQLKRK